MADSFFARFQNFQTSRPSRVGWTCSQKLDRFEEFVPKKSLPVETLTFCCGTGHHEAFIPTICMRTQGCRCVSVTLVVRMHSESIISNVIWNSMGRLLLLPLFDISNSLHSTQRRWTNIKQGEIYRYRPLISLTEALSHQKRFKLYHPVKSAEVFLALTNSTT